MCMMKAEFERLVGKDISDVEWDTIETVYMYHPRNFTKDEIATLYKIGGMEAINGLYQIAKRCKEITEEIERLTKELNELKRKYGRN